MFALQEQGRFSRGDLIWAKTNRKYWPGMILCPQHIDKPVNPNREWIYWFGDKRISEVRNTSIIRFHVLFERQRATFFYTLSKTSFAGMLEALKIYKSNVVNCEHGKVDAASAESDEELLQWAFDGFPGRDHSATNEIPSSVFYHLQKKANIRCNNFVEAPKQSSLVEKYKDTVGATGKFCLACFDDVIYTSHPLFEGSLCFTCKERFTQRFFLIDTLDKIHYCCAVCSSFGNVIVCSVQQCGLSYCHQCIDNLASLALRKHILNAKRWTCFVCKCNPTGLYTRSSRHIKGRPDWRTNLHAFFNVHKGFQIPRILQEKHKIRVLSLFDGISTGLVALKQLDIDVEVCFASELDYNAKMIARGHHDELVYLGSGDIRELTTDTLAAIRPIHLVLGGSPCNDLSVANPIRKGLFEKSGTGILFYEFWRIITTLKQIGNGDFFWLYENVASMSVDARNTISRFLECQPSRVNAACVSPQRRVRYFWGNLPSLHANLECDVGEHSLQDYLEPRRSAAVHQIRTITTNGQSLFQGRERQPVVYDANNEASELTINEIEHIFGVPKDYTHIESISKSARLTLLGKAWSVQNICMLLHCLKYFYKLTNNNTTACF